MPEYTTGRATPIKNRNFLAPTGFKFTLDRAKSVSFFCNQANIPDISLGVAEQPTYLKDIPLPGDKMTFEDLNLKFLVDEDLKNYMEIQNWMRGLGYPESLKEIYNWQRENPNLDQPEGSQLNLYCDATLIILNSSNLGNFKVNFRDVFPTSLSTLTFDATPVDIDYFTAEVSFKYTIYDITDMKGNNL